MDYLVMKSEYAQMRGRKPSAVSNWIADGKLEAPAITEDGQINVALADAMLAERLDPTQQLAQSRPLAGDLVDEDDADLLEEVTKTSSTTRDAPRRYLDAKAEEKELDVERKRRQQAAEAGKWVETAQVVAVWNRNMAAVFTDLEAWVTQAGEELATKLETDPRLTTLALRESLRQFRERQAAREAANAAS